MEVDDDVRFKRMLHRYLLQPSGSQRQSEREDRPGPVPVIPQPSPPSLAATSTAALKAQQATLAQLLADRPRCGV